MRQSNGGYLNNRCLRVFPPVDNVSNPLGYFLSTSDPSNFELTMSPPRVLRVARSDSQDAFVLVHVVNTGPAALDLTLTATEGECPYVACGTSLLGDSEIKPANE